MFTGPFDASELFRAGAIITMMRRCLYALLIVLLPLRAWVGDAMAMQMALQGSTVHAVATAHQPDSSPEPEEVAGHAHAHAVTSTPDCGGHASGETPTPHGQCQTCTACQACHNMVIPLPVVQFGGLHRLAFQLTAADQSFASADRALVRKPPIS